MHRLGSMTAHRTASPSSILGDSFAARAMRVFAARAAEADVPVLLLGETGTGKGLLARIIHGASRRSVGTFVAVNCAAVGESLFESEFFGHVRGAFTGATRTHRGLFEQANGGTLFLDEIGELSTPLQAKLLTALEDGSVRRVGGEGTARVDVRVIAATNCDLTQTVAEGRFRRDLYFRLLVLAFELPPLRCRRGDVPLLLEYFLELHATRHGRAVGGIEPRAYARLRDHPWPGNVRQLDRTMEAAVLACDGCRIELRHLPELLLRAEAGADLGLAPSGRHGTRGRYSFAGSPAEEFRQIDAALRRSGGNRTRAARELGMARNTLRARLAALAPLSDSTHPAMSRKDEVEQVPVAHDREQPDTSGQRARPGERLAS